MGKKTMRRRGERRKTKKEKFYKKPLKIPISKLNIKSINYLVVVVVVVVVSLVFIRNLFSSVDVDSDDESQEPLANTDVEMLTSLTGTPLVEDELIFAVPVVAPYNTLQNYKWAEHNINKEGEKMFATNFPVADLKKISPHEFVFIYFTLLWFQIQS